MNTASLNFSYIQYVCVPYDAQRRKRALNGTFLQFYFLRFLVVAIFYLFSGIIHIAKFICFTPQEKV